MATNWRITTVANRFINHIRTASALDPTLIFSDEITKSNSCLPDGRGFNVSYDKNIDDQVRPSLVPEEAITRGGPEKYWAPHPKTGVFGPADEQKPGGSEPATMNGSVLEEKTFFRPLEDLEKPNHP